MISAQQAERNERTARQRLQAEQSAAYERATAQDIQRRQLEEQVNREAALKREKDEAERRRQAAESQTQKQREEAVKREHERALSDCRARRRRERAERRARLTEEPPATSVLGDAAVVRIRLLDGRTLQRRFAADNLVQAIYDYVDVEAGEAMDDFDFEVVSSPEKMVLDQTKTIREAGLMPRVLVSVREVIRE